MTVIKHGNVLQHILLSCETGLIMAPVDSLLFEAAEKAFCHSIVETIAGTAHTTHKAMYFHKLAVLSLLAYCNPRSECAISPACGWCCQIAILSASQTSLAFILEPMLQPTTFLENKSMTTARYSQRFPRQNSLEPFQVFPRDTVLQNDSGHRT